MITKTIKPKKCRVCRTEFRPAMPLAVACSPICALTLARKVNGKAKKVAQVKERKADKIALEKFKSIAKLIAEAQVPFNAVIRERDKEKGCFVCKRPFLAGVPGRVQHAGHVRSRGAAGHLRFNQDNCHGECEGCNGPHGAKPHQIKAGAIERIGLERYEALENDNTPRKWQREELIAIKETYVQKLKELKGRAA